MNLNRCIHQFFEQYLPHIKGCSVETIRAYRDTFKLFLPFAAKYHRVKIKSLTFDHLTGTLILDFLDHLFDIDLLGEEKTAHNLEGHLGFTVFF